MLSRPNASALTASLTDSTALPAAATTSTSMTTVKKALTTATSTNKDALTSAGIFQASLINHNTIHVFDSTMVGPVQWHVVSRSSVVYGMQQQSGVRRERLNLYPGVQDPTKVV